MNYQRNRFELIAGTWIVCAFFDIVILTYVEFYTVVKRPDDIYKWIYECWISFSFIASIGSILSGVMLSLRIWKQLAIPGTCLLVWGFMHSLIAVSYTSYYTIKIPRLEIICVTIVSLIGTAFIIASLFAIFSARVYQNQQQQYRQFS